jgi:ATP-binding cassette, subfamily B, bacterial
MKSTNTFIRLFHYSSPNKSTLFFACLCSILNKLFDIVPEILIGIAIDVIVNQKHSIISKLGIKNPFYQLYLVGALTALLWILESVFEYLYSIAWRNFAQDIQHTLRLKTYAAIQESDLAYFEDSTTGNLLTIVYDDIQQLEQFLSQGPNEILQLIVNILVMGAIFFYVSPTLALLTLLPIPLVIAIAYYFQSKLASLYELTRQAATSLASHIAYRLQGITTIKSYTTEHYELNKLRVESDLYARANYNAYTVSSLYIPLVRMAIMIGFILALVVGGIYALQGHIPINWYASLVFLTQRFLWPFTSLAHITDMYERARACAKRILVILSATKTIKSGTALFDIPNMQGKINFNQVSFSYSTGKQIFNNLSFEIPAAKTVAFVGATGSGKSTIIKLLLRFYDSSSGSITIDDHTIKNSELANLRASMALVSQDIYLVDGTIYDNIAYGSSNVTLEQVIQAATIAQAHTFIENLPERYTTKVQEHGKNLSGGQRQRLAIARAICKRAPILIFDEATSAVDNETELAISKSLLSLSHGQTIILIAHRLSTVRHADTIFVMDKGTIIEQGTHDELLKNNSTYALLWKIQTGEIV